MSKYICIRELTCTKPGGEKIKIAAGEEIEGKFMSSKTIKQYMESGIITKVDHKCPSSSGSEE